MLYSLKTTFKFFYDFRVEERLHSLAGGISCLGNTVVSKMF